MNSKVLLLLLIVSGLTLAAITARNGGLLLLAVPFLTYMLIALIQFPDGYRLAASRTTDRSSVLAGDLIQVTLRLTNQGDAVANLRVEDSLPAGAQVPGVPCQQVLSLRPHTPAEMSYAFTSARGICAWQSVDVFSADPLGLLETRMRIAAPGEVIVRPAPIGMPRFSFKPTRTLHTAGLVAVPLPGSGTDFLGVREYRMGDPLRRINWRLAARNPGKLFTNEHERHEAGDYGLILDARQADGQIFERALSAAASLADYILGDGNRLSLLVFGKSMTATYPGYGKRQLSLVLRSLAAAAPSPFIPLDYLEYFPTRLFPNRAVLLMISSAYPSDHAMYSRLRAAGFEILLVSSSPIHSASHFGEAPPGKRLALRAAHIERRATLLALSKLGVHIVDWQADQPIQSALENLSAQAIRRWNRRT